MKATPQVKWAVNQKLEAVQLADRVEFWGRGKNNVAEFLGEVVFASLSEAVRHRAMSDGIKKRINDACAGKEPSTVVPAFCAHYGSGTDQWDLRGITARLDRGAMFQALATASAHYAERSGKVAKTAAEFEAQFRSTEDSVLRLRLAIPEVAAAYAALTAKGGGDELLDSLTQ